MYKITSKMKKVAKILGIDILQVVSTYYNIVVDFLVITELDKGDVSSRRAQELSEIATITDVITRCIQVRDFALADELSDGKITEQEQESILDSDNFNIEELDLEIEEPEVDVVIRAYYISKSELKKLFSLVRTSYKKAEIINYLMTA